MSDPKFELGQLVATRPALEALSQSDIHKALKRHAQGDWGDVSPTDAKENFLSVDKRLRILSIYHTESGQKFYVLTEADRSSTCVMLPDDY